MKTITVIAIISLVFVILAACGLFFPTQGPDTDNPGEEAEVRSVVEGFGKRLQLVSLQSPQAPQEIKAHYGVFVAPSLLEAWMRDVTQAPGRMVSNPWPDRMEITALEKAGDAVYQAAGFIVQVTSVEAVEGDAAARLPVKIVLQRVQDRWLITDYTEGLGFFATQTAPADRPPLTLTLPSATSTSKPVYSSDVLIVINTPFPPAPDTPTQTPRRLVNEIHFRKGGTSAYFQKSIASGKPQVYTFSALAGQKLILAASSPKTDVFLDLYGLEDGSRLIMDKKGISNWSGTLHKSQPYRVTLTTDNPDTYYFLSIEIPVTIQFETGAYSDIVDAYVDVNTKFHPDVITRVRYLALASAGQTMTVKLAYPNLDDLSFGVVGQQDGQVYVRYQIKNNGGEVHLPVSQGYYLDVYSVSGISTAFTLDLTIR